jgi:hypothetical protein
MEGDARELAHVAAPPFREGDCMTHIIPPLRIRVSDKMPGCRRDDGRDHARKLLC